MEEKKYMITVHTYFSEGFFVVDSCGQLGLRHQYTEDTPNLQFYFYQRKKEKVVQVVVEAVKKNPKLYRFISKIEVKPVDKNNRFLEEKSEKIILSKFTQEEYNQNYVYVKELYKTNNGSIIFKISGDNDYNKYNNLEDYQRKALIEDIQELTLGDVLLRLLSVELEEVLSRSSRAILYKNKITTLYPSSFDYNYVFLKKKNNEKLQRVVDATLRHNYQEISVTKRPFTSVVKKELEYSENGYIRDSRYLDIDEKEVLFNDKEIKENSIHYIYVIKKTFNYEDKQYSYYYSKDCSLINTKEAYLDEYDEYWYEKSKDLLKFYNYQSALEFFEYLCEDKDLTLDYKLTLECVHINGRDLTRTPEDIEVIREYETL
jgi:hypothetical protein|nr:MAG TPA: hypothetical protein [Caudoviricetes sp.]